jgi:cell division protein FtsL
VKKLYTVWIRIDETLPWIELKGEYSTKSEAKRAAREAVKRIGMKVVSFPEKRMPMKALVATRAR